MLMSKDYSVCNLRIWVEQPKGSLYLDIPAGPILSSYIVRITLRTSANRLFGPFLNYVVT
jgi:hypothetical protein